MHLVDRKSDVIVSGGFNVYPGEVERVIATVDGIEEAGELCARGPNLFAGYWPDGADGPDADGWLLTGDIAYRDADGDLRLVDRRRDLVLVSGFNVYPGEVERVLDEHPDVAESAVIGVPDPRTGEAVHAVVVRADGEPVDEAALLAHARASLARFKVPVAVHFLPELPHSLAGKVSRSRLRELGLERVAAEAAAGDGSAADGDQGLTIDPAAEVSGG